MIDIVVNGEKQTVTEDINIKEMIVELDYRTEGFAVALNGTFVALKAYETTTIKANDSVEILSPVQGG
jgi:sulfur carrier protein